jgi:uncharacterized membrane protein
MNVAEKEQDFRHLIFSNKQKEDAKRNQGERWINYLGLLISFVVIMSGLALSYYLIREGKEVIGTIFSGGMIVVVVSLYLNFVRQPLKKE